MDSRHRGCIFDCDIRGIPLHSFPHPVRKPELFTEWCAIVGLQGTNPMHTYVNKRICSRHFSPEHRTSGHRLVQSARPTLNLQGVTRSLATIIEEEHNYSCCEGVTSANCDRVPPVPEEHIVPLPILSDNESYSTTSATASVPTQALRASRRFALPLSPVPASNITQRIIRRYSQIVTEQELKTPETTASQEHEDHQYEENVKNHILEKALEFVPKSGWSVESLSAGAKAAGYPTITHGLFPNGGGDLVHYFNVKSNNQLVEQMKTWPKEDTTGAKVPAKFVENAIVTRLLMIEPYKSTWPKAMAIQTMPSNVPNCLATLLSLVDDICYHSGDRSVDFNWYVRRVGLAGIYKTAELFYLTDRSEGNIATRSFVSSRIRDTQLVQMALNLNPVAAAPQTLSAAFVTAKNILGINPLK